MNAELLDRLAELRLALNYAIEVASELETMLEDWPLLKAIIASMKEDLEAEETLVQLIEFGLTPAEEPAGKRSYTALPEPPEPTPA